MRKMIIGLALAVILSTSGCRWVAHGLSFIPGWPPVGSLGLGKWIDGGVFNIYTGNGHYDGKTRWDNFTSNWQRVQNVADIYFFNYDIKDPYVGAPFFGDPR